MIAIKNVKGLIFDMDETLLDNGASVDPENALHERSRLAAVHEVGRIRNIPALLTLNSHENLLAFNTAKTHTLAAAVWNILFIKGLVKIDDIDLTNPIFQEIVSLKNEKHEAILREFGKEIKDASAFVRLMGVNGLTKHMAIASSAVRRDINIFIDMVELENYFPNEHIVSLENVTRFKPDPEGFNLAFTSLGLLATDRRFVIGFEDDPRGVQAAKAAGLTVFAINTRFAGRPEVLYDAGADFVADTYAEFASILGLSL